VEGDTKVTSKIVRAYCGMGVCFAERVAYDDRVDSDGMHDEKEEAEGKAVSELHKNRKDQERGGKNDKARPCGEDGVKERE
jgi:hypothetical protein